MMSKAEILALLQAGSPEGAALACALASSGRAFIDPDIEAAAVALLEDLASQPKPPRHTTVPPARKGYFLQDGESGDRIEIRGFAALFGSKSVPLPCNADLPEILAPGAFSEKDFDRVILTRDHSLDAPVSGDLQIAQSPMGLMFRLRHIPATVANAKLVFDIEHGLAHGCSYMATMSGRIRDLDGEKIFVADRAEHLHEITISIANQPAYLKTGVWLSTQRKHQSETFILRTMWDDDVDEVKWITAGRRRAAA